ncbi:MAG TPA: rod shape-determining protein MreC [Actinomycetes bacterium]|nr:rod shape-determining protein MreC [Actinomycetes bacterium]
MLAVLLLAAVVVITLDFREGPDGPVARLRRVTVAVFGPVQRVASAATRPIGDFAAGVAGLGRLRSDNRRLQAEVDRLRSQERTYQDVLAENGRLRGALAMAQRCGCTTVGASVVAASGSNFQWSVTIDAGATQGIAADMAVLDADGLVGRVSSVTADYATVLLISDPSSGVAASLARNKAPGILRGQGEQDLTFEPVRAGTDVRAGDSLVTQGYQGGIFPAGIPIGAVSRVDRASATSLVARVSVQPYSDLGSLDVVAVVVAKPTPPRRAGSSKGS